MEAEVLALGGGMCHTAYWELSPRVILKYCEKRVEILTAERQEKYNLAWLQGYYTAVGISNPKKFPRQPHKVDTGNKPKSSVQSPEEQRAIIDMIFA